MTETRREYLRQYRIKNAEHIKAYKTARMSLTLEQNRLRLLDPVKAATDAESKRRWLRKQWREDSAFREASIERNKEWRKKNIAVVQEYKAKDERQRRAAKLGVSEHFTAEMRKRVLEQFSQACFLCLSKTDLCMDHHQPLTAGNALEYGNAVCLCRSCNAAKSNYYPQYFYSPDRLLRLEEMLVEQKTFVSR